MFAKQHLCIRYFFNTFPEPFILFCLNISQSAVLRKPNVYKEIAVSSLSQFCMLIISNGNRTEWSPIRSVIIRVITKSDDCAAGVRFVNQLWKIGKICIKIPTKEM